MSALTDYQRQVWEMSRKGLAAPQIAEQLGKSSGSVRGTLSQVRKREARRAEVTAPSPRLFVSALSVQWSDDLLGRIRREIREERDRLDAALEAIS